MMHAYVAMAVSEIQIDRDSKDSKIHDLPKIIHFKVSISIP